MKLWGGRFKCDTSNLVEAYNASVHFDYKLADYDIQGSLAHVMVLKKCGVLDDSEADVITQGLHDIREQLHKGEFEFSLSDEDVHMNIERALHRKIGDTAGKLHTGRSRNDQVALDLHLYLRNYILHIIQLICDFGHVLVGLAEKNIDVIIPGYTHLQRAEPVRFAHHMMAYFNMFHRDAWRLIDCFSRVNVCPLGAGALAGSAIDVDRDYAAELLYFDDIYENSLDAVSDRDYIAEFLFNASLIMMHFSKLSEEVILWCSQEFSFVQLGDGFCTGSSMMPQKKNPDVAELARGKTGRVYGSLIGMLTVLKGLPLAYNKDLQEDKEGLFDAVDTICATFPVYKDMLSSITLNRENISKAVNSDFSNATQLANYMVKQGVVFREAHKITGEIVAYCIDHNKLIHEMHMVEFEKFHTCIKDDIYDFITIDSVVEAHAVKGGTAKQSVLDQVNNANKKLSEITQWLSNQRACIK